MCNICNKFQINCFRNEIVDGKNISLCLVPVSLVEQPIKQNKCRHLVGNLLNLLPTNKNEKVLLSKTKTKYSICNLGNFGYSGKTKTNFVKIFLSK